ncbi:hypothetical protein [Pseudoalteromonas sp. S16_S37]|uniref:hypothetical protein n=1 Tax=Pseudoalteromonas sp. S16_S37 TaxID=2720228 RepID=UPI00167FF91E|nr:hypothetical protein [Pseudoalteromonas sp. S16_S37]MBD1583950.1 hypothetical protein [Pseudoalteromonas sp. S16_S37]
MPTKLAKIHIKLSAASNDSAENINSLKSLWEKIEKKEKRNENLKNKINTLYRSFEETVLPYEKDVIQQVVRSIRHLLTFIPKKSLTSNQREELMAWIDSEIDYLENHPFGDDIDTVSLRGEFSDALTAYHQSTSVEITDNDLEQLRIMLNSMFHGQLDLSEDELRAIAQDPSQLEAHIKKLSDSYEKVNGGRSTQDTFDNEDEEFEHQDEFKSFFEQKAFKQQTDEETLDKLFKSSQLNKMYKRLASILHPDKEVNESKKAEKHEIMQQLLAARENNDAVTILRLYQNYVADADFTFDNKTLAALEKMLRQKAYQLDLEHQKIKTCDEPPVLVWRRFSARSKKAVTEGLEAHIENLKKELIHGEAILAENKTVKAMARHLSERIQQNHYPSFNYAGSLDNVFDLFDL